MCVGERTASARTHNYPDQTFMLVLHRSALGKRHPLKSKKGGAPDQSFPDDVKTAAPAKGRISCLSCVRYPTTGRGPHLERRGGARRNRTDDLLNANQALSQLSYGPNSVIIDDPSRKPAIDPAVPGNQDLVGRGGLEPPTSRLSGVRSNHLSYRPLRPTAIEHGQAGGKRPRGFVYSPAGARLSNEGRETKTARKPHSFLQSAKAAAIVYRSS